MTLVLTTVLLGWPELGVAAFSGVAAVMAEQFVNSGMATAIIVPMAVFAALIVPALPGSEGELGVRVVAAAAAGLVIWHLQSLWMGILVGMASFWLLRFWL